MISFSANITLNFIISLRILNKIMKRLLALAMVSILLLSMTCITPVIASHQRSFVEKVSPFEKSVEVLSKKSRSKERFKLLSFLRTLLNIFRTLLVLALTALRMVVNLAIFILNIFSKILGILIVLLS